MKLLEYQSKALLESFGLAFTRPTVVTLPEAAASCLQKLGTPAVIKAQVPFGGRGKAGAIRFVETAEQASSAASELLGLKLRGTLVESISVEPRISFGKEFYMGVTWDTSAKVPVAILSSAGGIHVEQSESGQLARRTFDPWLGICPFQGREMAVEIGLSGKMHMDIGLILSKLVQAFLAIDGVTVEINPLVLNKDGTFVGLDAHVAIDDDAEFRQLARLASLGEIRSGVYGRQPTPLEQKAKQIDSIDHRGVAGRVVEFDGNLGLLIGGGGASLTVFDAIRRHGGQPANYCEMGGNPTEEKVAALTELILSKPGVEKLAVIMNVVNNTRADIMARGVLDGIGSKGLNPAETILVFRIPGSWEDEAAQILSDAGVQALGREVSLDQCARIAVERMGGHAA